MAVAKDIQNGDKLRESGKLEEALASYNSALKDNGEAFKAHIGKAQTYQKLQKYDYALSSLETAKKIAFSRGKKELIDEVMYRFFAALNNRGDLQEAVKYLNLSIERGYMKTECQLWLQNIDKKAAKKGVELDLTEKYDVKNLPTYQILEDFPSTGTREEGSSRGSSASQSGSGSSSISSTDVEKEKRELEKKMANHDNLYPVTKDIRLDWFQSSSTVTVTLFIKNLPQDDKLKVNYTSEHISIEFPTGPSSKFQYEIGPLYGKVQAKDCTHKVFATKLEINLPKVTEFKWQKLERDEHEKVDVPSAISEGSTGTFATDNGLKYPNSSKKSTDWSRFTLEDEQEDGEKNAGSTDEFFQMLYKDADDDTKRAMMKSFYESKGTALSTNWSEVSQKTVEVSPPDGAVERKF